MTFEPNMCYECGGHVAARHYNKDKILVCRRCRIKELRPKWFRFQMWHNNQMLMEIMFEPSPAYYLVFGEPTPPLKEYCIDSWTEKHPRK